MEVQKEILAASYWEHVKYAKELSFFYPPEHPKRIKIERIVNELAEQRKAVQECDATKSIRINKVGNIKNNNNG